MSCSSLRRPGMARVNEGWQMPVIINLSINRPCHLNFCIIFCPRVTPWLSSTRLSGLRMSYQLSISLLSSRRASPHFPLRAGLGGLVRHWGGLPARRRTPIPGLVEAADNRTTEPVSRRNLAFSPSGVTIGRPIEVRDTRKKTWNFGKDKTDLHTKFLRKSTG